MISTAQVAQRIGVSKNTLLRWINENLIDDVERDWRGWRIWQPQDIERLKTFQVKYHSKKIKRLKRHPVLRADFAKAAAQSMSSFAKGYIQRPGSGA